MTPKEYKARYNNIKVKKKDGTIETVRVNRYVLNESANWFHPNALNEFQNQFNAKGLGGDGLTIFTPSGEVKVDPELTKAESQWEKKGIPMRFEIPDKNGGVRVSTNDNWWGYAYFCFIGKGAPEHCQVALQLADRYGLAPNGLQAYADSAIGLDCNGFVGNYIWHGKTRHMWTNRGVNEPLGPDSLISNFFNGSYVKQWEDINPSNTYLFGMVDKTGQIIPGGKSGAGHIMITQAGMSAPGHWDTYSPKLWVVESTAGSVPPGLHEGWYECLDYNKKTGIFHLDRGDDFPEINREIYCKIVALT